MVTLRGSLTGPRSPAEDPRQARRKLRQLDRTEGFARKYEQFGTLFAHELPLWQIPAMKERFANTYRRLVGIHPSQRHELRQRLEAIAGAPSQANKSPAASEDDVFA